jgi:nitrate/nitrite transport system ATP-binding protein
MITHDVDEAMLLADRILLMTNGPYARIAESVKVDLARPRLRSEIIHDPGYYPIRNHLVEFLVRRSEELSGAAQRESEKDVPPGPPVEVNPAADAGFGAGSAQKTQQVGAN